MAKIHLEKETKLSKDEVKIKVDKLTKDLQLRYGVKGEWKEDTYLIKASGVDGSIAVEDNKIKIDINLGLFASPFKGKIEEVLNDTLEREFS